MDYVGVENSYNYLINLGISPKAINKDGIGLALGTSGISTLEMAGAYACIANGGEYREPLAFSQVKDKNGNIVLDAEEVQEVRQVFKPSSAFMLVEALKEAVQSGTGTNARISGFTVAGKTGTNHSNRGIFFAGMTGYYTSTLWVGHDEYKQMYKKQGSDAAILWQRYMKVILEGKEDKAILEGSASDYGVTRYTVCGVSGMKCTDACSGDTFHPPVTDYFAVGDAPSKACNMHGSTVMCIEGKCAPGPYCPATSVQTTSGVIIPDGSPYASMSGGAESIFLISSPEPLPQTRTKIPSLTALAPSILNSGRSPRRILKKLRQMPTTRLQKYSPSCKVNLAALPQPSARDCRRL